MFKNSILVADLLKNERHISKLMRRGKCIYQPLQEYKEIPIKTATTLTLANGTTAKLTASALTYQMTNPYRANIVSVDLGDNVTSIGEFTFGSCPKLSSVTISDSVTTIGNNAFNNDPLLKEITFPNSVTSMGVRMFFNSSGLTSVTLSENITTLPEYTFYGCSILQSVTVPAKVSSLGESVFSNCSGLTGVTFLSTTPPTITTASFGLPNTFTIYVPANRVNAYKSANVWSTYASRIQAIP